MFELLSGKTLFHADYKDNIDQKQMSELMNFTAEFKDEKLSEISDTVGRNLVSQLIHKVPSLRPQMKTSITHPFLTGKSTFVRLAGKSFINTLLFCMMYL